MISINHRLVLPFGEDTGYTDVVIQRIGEAVADSIAMGMHEVECRGWLAGLDKRVLIIPALAIPASSSARLSSSPEFLRALVHELRIRKPGLEIALIVSDMPGWSADEALVCSGLSKVIEDDQLGVVNVSCASRFWWIASDIPEPLPVPECVFGGSFIISLAALATNPVERLAGVLYHHLACLPGAWEDRFTAYRSRMMVWAAHLMPTDLCLVDGRFVADFSAVENSRILPGGVVILGKNPIAVDTIASRLVGVRPRAVPALARAYRVTGLSPDDFVAIGECAEIAKVSKPGVQYYDRRTEMIIKYLPYPMRRRLLTRLMSPSQAAYAVRALWRIVDRYRPGLGL
jgi:uncharacterized protein (DUF362 family)